MAVKVVGWLLDRLTTWVFPAVLVVLAGFTLLWQLGHADPARGLVLPMHVWEESAPVDTAALSSLAQRLAAVPPPHSAETRLSLQPFWVLLRVPEAVARQIGRAHV